MNPILYATCDYLFAVTSSHRDEDDEDGITKIRVLLTSHVMGLVFYILAIIFIDIISAFAIVLIERSL